MRSGQPTPMRLRFEKIEPSTTMHYSQRFSLQRKNLDKLLTPILFSHKSPSPRTNPTKHFRFASVPKQRRSPYADMPPLSRNGSTYLIGDELFQVELSQRPLKLNRPRKLSPIETGRLKDNSLEESLTKLMALASN